MKQKLFSLLFAIVASIGTSFAGITVRLDPQSCSTWSKVYLWAWTSKNGVETNLFNAWPGIVISQDIEGWYSYIFNDNISSVNIIWTDGNNQTIDITNVNKSTCFALNSTSGTNIGVSIVDSPSDWTPQAGGKFKIGDLYYNLNGYVMTAEVTYQANINNYSGLVLADIPDVVTYNGKVYHVTSIGERAFSGCSGLTSVNIPNSVTSIGEYAFSGCRGLTSVTIGNSVTSIGQYAFYNCSSLTSVTIPNSVTSIGRSAFSRCSMTSIDIPKSVTSIGKEAFSFCSSLASVTIPNSVTSIGEYAFYACRSLTSLVIPKSIMSIGICAFVGCSINSVIWNAKRCNDFSPDGTPFYAPWGNDYDIRDQIKSFTFGNDVEYIPVYLCAGMTNLDSLSIGSGISAIKAEDFSGCNNIKHITLNSNAIAGKTYSASDNLCSRFGSQVQTYILGDSVTNIGDYAFYGGSNISSIGIPSSVISIGNEAFSNCPQLSQVTVNSNAIVSKAYSPTNNFANIFGDQVQKYTLGDAITSIGDNAFNGCNNVIAFNLPNTITKIGNGAFQNCTGIESFTIPASVTIIWNSAFNGCTGISSIAIPNSVTSLGTNAFGDCSNITSVEFGNSLVSIGDSAFSSCYNLEAVQFPSSLQSIGNYAFYQCNRIPSVDIAGNITSLGEGTFKGCSKLTQVSVNSNAVMSKAYNATHNFATIFGKQVSAYILGDAITAIGDYAFYGNNISALTIPSSVTHIGTSALQGCSAIATLTIPDAITTIEDKTFQGCTSLASITMPDAITAIKDSAFLNCSSLVISSLPTSLTSLGSSAFSGCSSISSIAFPAALKTVGENAFANCIGIARMNIDDLAIWLSIDFANSLSNPLYYARNLYLNNELVSDLVIPNRITELKNYTFTNCSSITSVVIPNTVKAVSPTAFSGCENIAFVEWHSKNVTDYASSDNAPFYASRKKVKEFLIGEEVEHIPAYLCDGMSGISSLAFPSYLKSIGDCAFKGLTKIKQINVPNEVTAIGAHAFDSCILVTSIYLGYQVEEIGDYAFKGCIRVNDITSMNTTTPVVYDNTLSSISQYAYLYVQAGSKRTYQLDPYWSRFDIQELASEEASLTSDAVIVEANADNAIFTWPVCDTAAYYSLRITKDEEVFCTLVFNSNGQLTSIAFAPGRNGNAHAPAATLSVAGMSFTVTGLNTASKYAYRLAVSDEDNAELVAYSGEFATTGYTGDINPGGEPIATAIDGLTIDAQKTSKFIRNGQLFILRDGKTYTIQGVEVR